MTDIDLPTLEEAMEHARRDSPGPVKYVNSWRQEYITMGLLVLVYEYDSGLLGQCVRWLVFSRGHKYPVGGGRVGYIGEAA